MPTSLSWRQRGRLSTRPGGGMLLKTGGGKFLKNSAATGGMIQKNDIWSRLEIPVAIPHVAVPKVGGEGDHVARDALVVLWAVRQGLVREVEPQVMKPGTRLVFSPGDAQGPDESTEDVADRISVELPTF